MSEPKTETVPDKFGWSVTVRTSDGRRATHPEEHDFADLESLIAPDLERAAAAVVDEGVEGFRKMHPEDRLGAWAAVARVVGEIG